MLEPVHNQKLRLCIEAFRMSPVESVYVDAHKPSLWARRTKLSFQCASRLTSRSPAMVYISLHIVFHPLYLKKDHTLVYWQHSCEINKKLYEFIQIYTYGSWDESAIAPATVFPSETISKRLHNLASICTAKAQVIIESLDRIQHLPTAKFIIFTDTLSCLQTLQWMTLDHLLIGMVKRRCLCIIK